MPKTNKNAIVPCWICGKPSLYKFYDARACEGCKQFFRRTIVQQREYFCLCHNCNIKDEKCCGCRFDQCLKVGMKAELIRAQTKDISSAYIRRLEARRKMLSSREKAELMIPRKPPALEPKHYKLLEFLLTLEQKHRRIWEASTELPADFLSPAQGLDELLLKRENILLTAGQLPEVSSWYKAAYVRRCQENFLCPETIKLMAIDRLLIIEMAKALPFFRRLDLSDQKAILRHVSIPMALFINCYYSLENGANTWTRANGLSFIAFLEASRFEGDLKLRKLANRHLCQGIAPLRKYELGREEFLLLLVLLYCNSAASGISPNGRELLYLESVSHAKLLMELLQHKFGSAQGASKFAEAMHLLDVTFHQEQIFLELNTYLEVFYWRNSPPNHAGTPKQVLTLFDEQNWPHLP